MWISRYFVLFCLYSLIGWVYETTYCTIKGKKWENRGFLYGPICPIYGAGACLATAVVEMLTKMNVHYTWWQIFLAGYFGSIFLEYTTHWALEKLFHAYWWDYSYMPFNIKGRVCLPYSICFGAAAVLIAYTVAPFMLHLIAHIPSIWFEVLGLLFMCVLGMDLALTVSALSDFENYVSSAEEALNKHMDQFVDGIVTTKFLEEKEKFSMERVTSSLKNMSALSKAAIKRVQGFRPKKNEGIARNKVLEFVKGLKPERNKTDSGDGVA